jgi:hypothetical protein
VSGQERLCNHLSPFGTEVKNVWSFTSASLAMKNHTLKFVITVICALQIADLCDGNYIQLIPFRR